MFAFLATLCGAGGGLVWGQLIIQPNLSNVNNDFGAGESVTITNGAITTPGIGVIAPGSAGRVTIGGQGALNQVIHVYNGDGSVGDFVQVLRVPRDSGSLFLGGLTYNLPDRFANWTSEHGNSLVYANHFNEIPDDYFQIASGKGPGYPNAIAFKIDRSNHAEYYRGVWTDPHGQPCRINDHDDRSLITASMSGNLLTVKYHGMSLISDFPLSNSPTSPVNYYTTTADGSYTRTVGGHGPMTFNTDGGVKLVQFKSYPILNGQQIAISEAGKDSTNDVPTGGPWYIDNYVRPTTVAFGGSSTLDLITLDTIGWTYRVDTASVREISDYSGLNRNTGECVSGKFRAYAFNGGWDSFTRIGMTRPDAAIQLLGGSSVCVAGNVQDKTGNLDTKASDDADKAKTQALIVWPRYNRATLRTGGNFKANMAHLSPDSSDLVNVHFSAADFPDPAQNIYLYSGTAPTNVGTNMITYTSMQVPFHNKSSFVTATATRSPYTRTTGSVFGVFGDYNHDGLMADIHTDTVNTDFNGRNPGVIEVGYRTANKSRFHVYSNGMLKNFEGCGVTDNFPMQFGTSVGGTPEFNITTGDSLYIVNFGNNATSPTPGRASLEFYAGAVGGLGRALQGNGAGALHVQALNNVELNADDEWSNANGTEGGNNVYILSDAGNIVTQDLTLRMENTQTAPGFGRLNLLAAGETHRPGASPLGSSRRSLNGNLYINGHINLSHSQDYTPPAVGPSTQSNFIARNNIRTYKFELSRSNNWDTTNFIAKEGDLYLGYSAGSLIYDGLIRRANYTQSADFGLSYDNEGPGGSLNLLAGFDDAHPQMTKTERSEGGNIYFTQIKIAGMDSLVSTIAIPYSSEYISCKAGGNELHKRAGESMMRYEHSGIIGGRGRGGKETAAGWAAYAGQLDNPGSLEVLNNPVPITPQPYSLKHISSVLTVDAGRRGNIILNQGVELAGGPVIFRTREGDIDVRGYSHLSEVGGGVLFLAQVENLADLSKVDVCGCNEMQNNVYIQDLNMGRVGNTEGFFFGADNNIKLNYGGLPNQGTRNDPFLSTDYAEDANGHPLKKGSGYIDSNGAFGYHCDLDPSENKANNLRFDFTRFWADGWHPIQIGGVAAVASDRIDVYKKLTYMGGNGQGLGRVPTSDGTLHGENVSGYGLFFKTQANKGNWTHNRLLETPECPTFCEPSDCNNGKGTAFLHNTARMTFHDELNIQAHGQRVLLESPVIEVFGKLTLNTEDSRRDRTEIVIRTDSLICHDGMEITGDDRVRFESWTSAAGGEPVIKLGYSRHAAPTAEYATDELLCRECVSHYKGKVYASNETPLDTTAIRFSPSTKAERKPMMVIDHTVFTFLTDSFDHVKGGEVIDAKYVVDTLKTRHQVEFFTDANVGHSGHLELISEEQTQSKDYAGMYARHLHLEPIGACGNRSSELWIPDLALNVITGSTLGGFGTLYADGHVENGGHLNAGFTSLRLRGQCYEQRAGTLTMKDLRLDAGAQLHFSLGSTIGLNGEFSDAIDVDRLTIYGSVDVNVEVRACERIEKRCYPLIYYKSVTPNSLNNLKLHPRRIKIQGEEVPIALNITSDGVVYLCVGGDIDPIPTHTVTMPEVPGVTTVPAAGIWPLTTRKNFRFTAVYSGSKPLVVRTNRPRRDQDTLSTTPGIRSLIANKQNEEFEIIPGIKNTLGQYEYIVPRVQQELTLRFGPDVVANEEILPSGAAIWSYGERLYIRTEHTDVASIYAISGRLVKRIDLSAGDTSIPLSRGAYIVTLQDGSTHKVIVK